MVGHSRHAFRAVQDAFEEALEQGVFPGAVLLASKGDEPIFEQAFGFRSLMPERTPLEVETVFDLASLTKPLATTTALMLLVAENELRLKDRAARFLPDFATGGKGDITLRQLLSHCSGLPAWKPYYRDVMKMPEERDRSGPAQDARRCLYLKVAEEPLLFTPGTRGLYSDLGFIVLGQVVESVTGFALDEYCQKKIFTPLGLESMCFFALRGNNTTAPKERIAPTEDCPWRKRILCGEVSDENAYAMKGVSGHAGLFSDARDIHRFLMELRACYQGRNGFLPATLLQNFFNRDTTVPGWSYALGWDTPSEENSSSGRYFSPRSVGHLGFTGTSIWWDLEKDCHIIVLTNRVHPARDNDKIKQFRPRIHDLVMKSLET